MHDLVLVDVVEDGRRVDEDADGAGRRHGEEDVELQPIDDHGHVLPVLADLRRPITAPRLQDTSRQDNERPLREAHLHVLVFVAQVFGDELDGFGGFVGLGRQQQRVAGVDLADAPPPGPRPRR